MSVRAVAGFHRVLRPGGRALILVPASQSGLPMDEAIQHRKRYERADLRELLESSGLEIERLESFNRLGLVGWSVNRQAGRTSISPPQVSAFRFMPPLARRLERLEGLPGLSWIAVGRKSA